MEKINIAELLKDCPKGMELDCTIWDSEAKAFLKRVLNDDFAYPIEVTVKYNNTECTKSFTKYGAFNDLSYCKCVIFPKGRNTWEGFHRPFKDGDIIFTHSNCLKVGVGNSWISIFKEKRNGGVATYVDYAEDGSDYYSDLDGDKALLCMESDILRQRFASEEEKQKLFDAIKANGYRWNPETKTLEKLIEPKFKEIHFYKDLEDELGELGKAMNGECAFKYFYRSHNDTMIAIKKGNPTIHTYAISALCFSDLLDKGYKIFLHENGKCGELHECTTELTDKELRKGHNISNIWIGDGFKDFFYR